MTEVGGIWMSLVSVAGTGKGGDGTKAATPPNVKVMKRGATEFKHILNQVAQTKRMTRLYATAIPCLCLS